MTEIVFMRLRLEIIITLNVMNVFIPHIHNVLIVVKSFTKFKLNKISVWKFLQLEFDK